MSTIYVDALALTVGTVASGRRSLAPGAIEAVDRLIDSGHDVRLIGRPSPVLDRLFRDRVTRVTDVPDGDRDIWLITGDPERCDRHRPGLRMLLVGSQGQRALRTRHCDEEVRDLGQAVMTVLLADAMPIKG